MDDFQRQPPDNDDASERCWGKSDGEGAALPMKPWKGQRKGGRKRGLGQGAVVNENSLLLI